MEQVYIIGQRPRGQIRLSTPADTSIAQVDTYQKVAGTFIDGDCHCFTVSNNKLIYSGPPNITYLFNGTSDLKVSAPSEVWYGLYVNGSLVPEAQTPHTFLSGASTSTIAITALVILNPGDEIEVFCKSSLLNTVQVHTLNMTFWG